MKRICQTLAALALCAGLASAQDIKIAHVYDKTGPLEAYAKQTQAGLHDGPELRHRRHHDGQRAASWW